MNCSGFHVLILCMGKLRSVQREVMGPSERDICDPHLGLWLKNGPSKEMLLRQAQLKGSCCLRESCHQTYNETIMVGMTGEWLHKSP